MWKPESVNGRVVFIMERAELGISSDCGRSSVESHGSLDSISKYSSSQDVIFLFSLAFLCFLQFMPFSRKPFAKGFEFIFSSVILLFWYAVTVINCVSGKLK